MSRLFQIVRIAVLAVLLLAPAWTLAQENAGRSAGNGPPAGDRGRRDEAGNRRRGEGGGPGREGSTGGNFRRNRERNGDGAKGDDRESPRPTTDTKPATSTTSSMGEKSEAEKADEYASTTIKKYDKNGDGMIQENEQEGMGSMTKKADANGDHVITKNELVAMSLGRTSPAPATTSTPATSSSSSTPPSTVVTNSSSNTASESDSTSHAAEAKTKTASKTRKSYRFKTAKERQPSGLPSSFTSKDANGDGQVSMSEYSKTWNDRTAAEFQKYDLDNDGVITPEEAKNMK